MPKVTARPDYPRHPKAVFCTGCLSNSGIASFTFVRETHTSRGWNRFQLPRVPRRGRCFRARRSRTQRVPQVPRCCSGGVARQCHHRCGSSSSMHAAGCVATRNRTSARYSTVLTPFASHVPMSENRPAKFSPASSWPAARKSFRPSAATRSARSEALLSRGACSGPRRSRQAIHRGPRSLVLSSHDDGVKGRRTRPRISVCTSAPSVLTATARGPAGRWAEAAIVERRTRAHRLPERAGRAEDARRALTEAPRRFRDAVQDCAGAPTIPRARVPAMGTMPARSTGGRSSPTGGTTPDTTRSNPLLGWIHPSPRPFSPLRGRGSLRLPGAPPRCAGARRPQRTSNPSALAAARIRTSNVASDTAWPAPRR